MWTRIALLGLVAAVTGATSRVAFAAAQMAAPYELPPPQAAEQPPRPAVPPPIPEGYHAEQRSHRGLLVVGGLVFGLSYAGTFLAGLAISDLQSRGDSSSSSQSRGSGVVDPGWLFLPVVGPFAAMAEMGKVESELLMAGIAQAAGAAMLITGAAWKQTVVVPNTSVQVTLLPAVLGSRGHGIGLAGNF